MPQESYALDYAFIDDPGALVAPAHGTMPGPSIHILHGAGDQVAPVNLSRRLAAQPGSAAWNSK